jgi:hypothetical protein
MTMSHKDDLVNAAGENAGSILTVYKKYAKKKPVMLLELPEQLIYAYPYLEFKTTLSERSQKMLEKEYEEALTNKQFVIFVKDNLQKKLISFSVDEPEGLN